MCHGKTFFGGAIFLDIRGHVTSGLQMKMARYVWMEEETEYFIRVTKKKKKKNNHP